MKNGGIKPTGDILELINAYDAIRTAVGNNRQEIIDANVQKIYDLHKKNLWVISFTRLIPEK